MPIPHLTIAKLAVVFFGISLLEEALIGGRFPVRNPLGSF